MSFQPPSPQELATASRGELAALGADCLALLEPGWQPLRLFTQATRLFVASSVEVVPIRESGSIFQILLAMRPPDDPWWPNKWHLPGALLLPTDTLTDLNDFTSPVSRVIETDFEGTVNIGSPVNLFGVGRRVRERGSELVVFCSTSVELRDDASEPENGQFFDMRDITNNPPPNIIEGDVETIQRAAMQFAIPLP